MYTRTSQPTDDRNCAMTDSFSYTRTHTAVCALDRRMHTSPRNLRMTGTANTHPVQSPERSHKYGKPGPDRFKHCFVPWTRLNTALSAVKKMSPHTFEIHKDLGVQLRWVFTRDPEDSALVTDEQLDIDNVKDVTWMTAYTTECNVLHDVVYCLLSSLWSDFTDACSVSTHTPFTQLLCSQQLWEALLTAFPSSEYRSVFL